MFEVSFKIQHECPYTRFSTRYPDVRVVEWCNNRIHVMEVECRDIETFTMIDRDLTELLLWRGGKVLKKNFLEGNVQLILKTCRCSKISPNIHQVVEKNSCLVIPPVTYYDGWEHYRVIGFRESDYKKMFQDLNRLGPVEMVQKRLIPGKSIRDTFVMSLSSVFADLTEKQVNSITAAQEYGYYQVPKKVTAEDIARKLGVPRTTYEEHLRKAESKILLAVAPYVRMYASGTPRLVERPPEITAK